MPPHAENINVSAAARARQRLCAVPQKHDQNSAVSRRRREKFLLLGVGEGCAADRKGQGEEGDDHDLIVAAASLRRFHRLNLVEDEDGYEEQAGGDEDEETFEDGVEAGLGDEVQVFVGACLDDLFFLSKQFLRVWSAAEQSWTRFPSCV